jgi:methylisocitrate lyase
MPYLRATDRPSEHPGQQLRRLLARAGIVQMPGAYNGLAALQAKNAGFEALYLSGAAMSASMGLPDLGIITVDDVRFFITQIARAGLPILVDGDTGYGEALNVMNMVTMFEAAGAAAVHIEDQVLPKKCGHLNDKKLVDARDMAAKVAAAVKARRDLVIVARTDAVNVEGLDAAIARAKLYVEAGADAIFADALTSAEMFKALTAAVKVPVVANITEFGKTPYFKPQELESFGCKIVIWPVSALRMAAKSHDELYATLRDQGSAEPLLPRMQTRAELYEIIDLESYESLDASIVKTVLP